MSKIRCRSGTISSNKKRWGGAQHFCQSTPLVFSLKLNYLCRLFPDQLFAVVDSVFSMCYWVWIVFYIGDFFGSISVRVVLISVCSIGPVIIIIIILNLLNYIST